MCSTRDRSAAGAIREEIREIRDAILIPLCRVLPINPPLWGSFPFTEGAANLSATVSAPAIVAKKKKKLVRVFSNG